MKNTVGNIVVIVFLLFGNHVFAQNQEIAKKRIRMLSSKEFHGRGYVKDGMGKAAIYIAGELEKAGLKKFNDSYFQALTYSVNTFPSKLKVSIDGNTLIPGVDYLIGPATPSLTASYELFLPDSLLLNDTALFAKTITESDYKHKMLVVDYAQTENIEIKKYYINIMLHNQYFGGIIELIPNELMWAVRTFQNTYPVIKIKRESYNRESKNLKLKLKAKMIDDFESNNVIAYVEGKKDEFIVFTAHYDHLGHMGKHVYIPGAQDNASGTAMVLNLADYYSENQPEYSIAFMLFAGEEAGLFGSINYVLNPLFDLTKIKAVINLDMVGTGDDGITIVNGAEEEYKDIWNLFEEINVENEFFTVIKARGAAANSDHYPFNKMGVPAIFIYTMGGKTYYHNPKDKIETLTFTGYDELFQLLIKFVDRYE